jgi:hypothetical protein
MDFIIIKIKNWDLYNQRSDVKKSSWFRFEHSFFDSSQFFGWSPLDRLIWIYILCEASKQTTRDQKLVRIHVPHATAATTAAKKDLHRVIQNLKELQIVEVRTLRGRYADVTHPGPTDERTNERYDTNGTTPPAGGATPASVFIATYVNSYRARYGPKTKPSLDGKVQGSIKRLLASVPLERACQLIQVYCQIDDPWFKTKGHDFETFAQNLTKVGLALDTGRRPDGSSKGIQELLAEENEPSDHARLR